MFFRIFLTQSKVEITVMFNKSAEHMTYFDIEPVSGIVLASHKRFQVLQLVSWKSFNQMIV